MNSESIKKEIWNEGAKTGLLLGGTTIICMVLNLLLSKINANGSTLVAMVVSLVDILIWGGKLVGCVLILKMMMKRFANSFEGVSNAGSFRFGVVSVLFSSLLYAGFYLAYILFIDPQMLSEALEMTMQALAPAMDANSREALVQMEGSLPEITFFSNFLYCFIYGVILSAILSRNIPPQNPFSGQQD